MFIKTIVKTDKKSGKRYDYYRLCESYRLDGKPRHRTITSLGTLDNLESKEERKLLADRIEDMLNGTNSLFFDMKKTHIENYAKKFYKKIVSQKLYDVKKNQSQEQDNHVTDYQNIGLNSLVQKMPEKQVQSGSLKYCNYPSDHSKRSDG